MKQRLKLLITVKTYPVPSRKYVETVCTAGITEDGRWIRLYPVSFRYLDSRHQYRLYDWVEVSVRKRPPGRDHRKESYEPLGPPTILDHVSARSNWEERKRIILPHAAASIEAIHAGHRTDGQSLGIIRPRSIGRVSVEGDASEWSPSQRAALEQLALFGPQRKPLERPGHRFFYQFTCDDPECQGHRLQVVDWGLYELYRKIRSAEGAAAAVQKTKEKLAELVAADREAHFYVGMHSRFPSFMVLGMFSPRRQPPDGEIRMRFD